MAPALKIPKLTRRSAIGGLVSALSCPALAGPRGEPDFDVLIIGAGAAGIAAESVSSPPTKNLQFWRRATAWAGDASPIRPHLIYPMTGAHAQSTFLHNRRLPSSRHKPAPNYIPIRSVNSLESATAGASRRTWRRSIPSSNWKNFMRRGSAAMQQSHRQPQAMMTYRARKRYRQTSATGAKPCNSFSGPIASARSYRSFPPRNTPFLLTETLHDCVGKASALLSESLRWACRLNSSAQ